jgi:hypothetical protein
LKFEFSGKSAGDATLTNAEAIQENEANSKKLIIQHVTDFFIALAQVRDAGTRRNYKTALLRRAA